MLTTAPRVMPIATPRGPPAMTPIRPPAITGRAISRERRNSSSDSFPSKLKTALSARMPNSRPAVRPMTAPGTPPTMPPMTAPPRADRPAMIFIMICSQFRSSQLNSTSFTARYIGSAASGISELGIFSGTPALVEVVVFVPVFAVLFDVPLLPPLPVVASTVS